MLRTFWQAAAIDPNEPSPWQTTPTDYKQPLWRANGNPPPPGEVWHVSANWRNSKSLLDSVDDPPDEPFPDHQYTLIELQEEVKSLQNGKNLANFSAVKKRYSQALFALRWKIDQMYGVGMRQWPEILMEDMEPLTWFWIRKNMRFLESEIGGIGGGDPGVEALKAEVLADMKNLDDEIDKIKFDASTEAERKKDRRSKKPKEQAPATKGYASQA